MVEVAPHIPHARNEIVEAHSRAILVNQTEKNQILVSLLIDNVTLEPGNSAQVRTVIRRWAPNCQSAVNQSVEYAKREEMTFRSRRGLGQAPVTAFALCTRRSCIIQ